MHRCKSQHRIENVRELLRQLYIATKLNEEHRFRAMNDRNLKTDVLLEARIRVRDKQGASRIDGLQ